MAVPVDMHPVTSRSGWVRRAGYDVASESLYIEYKDATCRYDQVPYAWFRGLLAAPSAGEYIHRIGIYGWPYTKV